MVSEQLQGMYVNGPMAGRIINLPNPAPAKVTVAVNLNQCRHSDPTRPIDATSSFLTYSVNQPDNPMLPYVITLDSDFEDVGWYCPQCKAEAEVKYKLDKIRDLLDDEEDEEW